MKEVISGPVFNWQIGDNTRKFAVVTLPYNKAADMIMACRYSASSNKGEQREICKAHLKNIRNAISQGTYTPTAVSAGLRKDHREKLNLSEGQFSLEVDSDNPLPLTDGGHRLGAIDELIKEQNAKLSKEGSTSLPTDDEVKQRISQLQNLPINFTLHLDGDCQSDFVNLQLGRPVDSSHLLSLKIHKKMFSDPSMKKAFEVAKLLNKMDGSPYLNSIRLDSRGVAPLPISTLCSQGKSDIATSLVGLVKVSGDKSAEEIAKKLIAVYTSLREKSPTVFEEGKYLTLIGNGGTKGSSTMLIGVASVASVVDCPDLPVYVKEVFDKLVSGNFSGPTKRYLMKELALRMFAGSEEAKHEGIPISLLNNLSCSTFSLPALPKAPKAEKPVKEAKPAKTPKKKGRPKKEKTQEVIETPQSIFVEPPVPKFDFGEKVENPQAIAPTFDSKTNDNPENPWDSNPSQEFQG